MRSLELIRRIFALLAKKRVVYEENIVAIAMDLAAISNNNGHLWPDLAQRPQAIYRGTVAHDSRNIINKGRGELVMGVYSLAVVKKVYN